MHMYIADFNTLSKHLSIHSDKRNGNTEKFEKINM